MKKWKMLIAMKNKILSTILLVFVITGVFARQMDETVTTTFCETDKIPGRADADTEKAVAIKYKLESYEDSSVPKPVFEEQHFLGGEITTKWNLFQKIYRNVQEQSISLSGTTVEIKKPVVFNAVIKVNSYYKKALKKEEIPTETAVEILGHVLDCANLICFEYDTKNIEADLKVADNIEDIINVFKSIQIIYH